jgi:predicted RNA binding protein YcfA (HicA-like mRNA interferase family)
VSAQSAKGGRVLRALTREGWTIKRQLGSHRVLAREGRSDFVFPFHDEEEIGPRALARIASHTGLETTTSDSAPPAVDDTSRKGRWRGMVGGLLKRD